MPHTEQQITTCVKATLIYGKYIEEPCILLENDHDEKIMITIDELRSLLIRLPKIIAILKGDLSPEDFKPNLF